MYDGIKVYEFSNELFGKLRVVCLDGELYFCLNDICRAMEYKNMDSAVSDIKKAIVKSKTKNTKYCNIPITITHMVIFRDGNSKEVTQTVNMTYVNEASLYMTIFRSRKEKSYQLRDWIYDTIIPPLQKVIKI